MSESVPAERLEALADKYRRDIAGHYDSTLLRAQDGADFAKAVRALLAEAREGGKPYSGQCMTCGHEYTSLRMATLHEDDNPGHLVAENFPPIPTGTEGPGLRERIESLEAWSVSPTEMGCMITGPTTPKVWVKRDEVIAALSSRPVEGEKK